MASKIEDLEVEAKPVSPFRIPLFGGGDRVMKIESGVATRLLRVGDAAVSVRAWQDQSGQVRLRAAAVDPRSLSVGPAAASAPERIATKAELALAIERMRFALGVDDDLAEFYRRFRGDPLLGPLLRRRPYLRPKRRPWAWEAVAWAVVEQLIEYRRAALIQRRIVSRWGVSVGDRAFALRDVPGPDLIAGRAPAELAGLDLSPARSLALRGVAKEIAAGRCDPTSAGDDARLLRIPEIGPWTVQCLALLGRGDPDALPAGDLTYLKLVGEIAGLGRRATIAEVEEFYAPYAPFRGLAATWTSALLSRGPSPCR